MRSYGNRSVCKSCRVVFARAEAGIHSAEDYREDVSTQRPYTLEGVVVMVEFDSEGAAI